MAPPRWSHDGGARGRAVRDLRPARRGRGDVVGERQPHPELPPAGPGGDRSPPRARPGVGPLPVERVPPSFRVQRRRRLPRHVAVQRPARRPGVGGQPGAGGGGGGGGDGRAAEGARAVVGGVGAGGGRLRLRRVHGGPERAHRHRGGGCVAALGLRRPRPPRQPPRGPVGRPVGGHAGRLDRADGIVGGGRAHPRRRRRAGGVRAVAVVAGPGAATAAPAHGGGGRRAGPGPRRRAAHPGCLRPGPVPARRARVHVLRVGVDEQVVDRAGPRPAAARHERPVPAALLRHLQPGRGVELHRDHARHGPGGPARPPAPPERRGAPVVDLVRRRGHRAGADAGVGSPPSATSCSTCRCSTASACCRATSWRSTWHWPCCSRPGSIRCSCARRRRRHRSRRTAQRWARRDARRSGEPGGGGVCLGPRGGDRTSCCR